MSYQQLDTVMEVIMSVTKSVQPLGVMRGKLDEYLVILRVQETSSKKGKRTFTEFSFRKREDTSFNLRVSNFSFEWLGDAKLKNCLGSVNGKKVKLCDSYETI